MARKAKAIAQNEWSLTESQVKTRASVSIRNARPLLEIIGLYLKAFTDVEQQIERNIAHLLRIYNFETFDMLANRIPIQQKLSKLKKAAEARNSVLSVQIIARLNLFSDKCVEIRNDLAHGTVYLHGDDVLVTSMGRPLHNPSGYQKIWPRAHPPKRWTVHEIKQHALWLHNFYLDLDSLAASTFKKRLPSELSISVFQSGLSPEAAAKVERLLAAKKKRPAGG